jgi:hypothetical protein
MYLHVNITEQVKIHKNATLIIHCTPSNQERMRVSSFTSYTQCLAAMTVDRNWRVIAVLLYMHCKLTSWPVLDIHTCIRTFMNIVKWPNTSRNQRVPETPKPCVSPATSQTVYTQCSTVGVTNDGIVVWFASLFLCFSPATWQHTRRKLPLSSVWFVSIPLNSINPYFGFWKTGTWCLVLQSSD